MNLSDSLDLEEKAVMGVLVVAEFKSVVIMEVVPLLDVQSPIFRGSGSHFCTKFGCSSRTVGRTCSATSRTCFSLNFTYEECNLAKIFGALKLSEVRIRHFFESIYQTRSILRKRHFWGFSCSPNKNLTSKLRRNHFWVH